MAENLLRENHGLDPLVLSDVQLTVTTIDSGAYSSVHATVPLAATAKLIRNNEFDSVPASLQFVRECQLLKTLRHPNIVQFLGVCNTNVPSSRLALVMEKLLTSLHVLLEHKTEPPPCAPSPLSFFTLGLKCSVLHNVASGLDYLHQRTPPIVHGDLSARCILLSSKLVAKIANLGVARTRTTADISAAPVHMPPEAIARSASDTETAKYATSTDAFSFGVVTIFTIGEIFPRHLLARTCTELQRRSEYMKNVNTQLRACDQFREDHPLIRLIHQCLQDDPHNRPHICAVLRLLEEARAGIRAEESEKNKEELVRALQSQPGNQNLEHILHDLLTENAELKQQLSKKEAELTTAEQFAYTCKVSGPGLQSATASKTAHVLVELSDSSGRPCSQQQNVTAELDLASKSTSVTLSKTACEMDHVAIVTVCPSRYDVSYITDCRGRYKLRIRVNNREINNSPFLITVYPEPAQLGRPVRVVHHLKAPYDVAVNSQGELLVSECDGNQISVIDDRGEKIRTIGSHSAHDAEQMIAPAGIAIDVKDNIYVSSEHKLQKFSISGKLIICIGQMGSGNAEFNDPRGVTIHNNQLYICDRNNDRIQVFNLDLNFIRSISGRGKGRGEFSAPFNVKFDSAGHMYIAEYNYKRVQVLDINGRFLREFNEQEMKGPTAIHIVDKYVYVTDFKGHCIVVYDTSGQFVTTFGKYGHEEGEFDEPYCITSCVDGFIYVCDWSNNRLQIF